MKTPAGTPCRYYYEDFHRGRQTQECRLIKANRRSLPWTSDLCAKCRVPGVLQSSSSPTLHLELTVFKRFGLFKTLALEASCLTCGRPVRDPLQGCANCPSSVH